MKDETDVSAICILKNCTEDQHQIQVANKAKLKSYSHMPKLKFGYQIPHDHMEAMFLDKKNGNTKWAEAKAQEMKSPRVWGLQGPREGRETP